ncbi:HD domain-containing protein [bacterium]|nr:HD domain-containing protein [bacterium]
MKTFPLSPSLKEVVRRIQQSGGRLWVVGGAIRDFLLGQLLGNTSPSPLREIDLATDLLPEQINALFPGSLRFGERFGTVVVRLGGEEFEVTTLRREGDYTDGRRPELVEFTDSIEADLARRDFTVNAIARSLPSGELSDPFNGREDLKRGIIRAVGEPSRRLAEDGLRAYRGCRFAATLGLEIEPKTLRAISANREVASQVAWERVGAELQKAMTAAEPSRCFELLRQVGLLDHCLPELAVCYGVTQNRHHDFDVYDHSLRACDLAPAEKPAVRWAALLHDIGKVETKTRQGRDFHFHGHEELSARLAERALQRLRLPKELRRRVTHLIARHMFLYQPQWSDAAVRRFVRRVGVEQLADLFDLAIADRLAKHREGRFHLPADIDELMSRIEELRLDETALTIGDLAIGGAELLTITEKPAGPWVGTVLHQLLELVLERPELNQREELLHEAERLLSNS